MRAFLRPHSALAVARILAGCHGSFGRPVRILSTPAPDQMRRDIDYLASDALGACRPGNMVEVVALRGGKEVTFKVTLSARS